MVAPKGMFDLLQLRILPEDVSGRADQSSRVVLCDLSSGFGRYHRNQTCLHVLTVNCCISTHHCPRTIATRATCAGCTSANSIHSSTEKDFAPPPKEESRFCTTAAARTTSAYHTSLLGFSTSMKNPCSSERRAEIRFFGS